MEAPFLFELFKPVSLLEDEHRGLRPVGRLLPEEVSELRFQLSCGGMMRWTETLDVALPEAFWLAERLRQFHGIDEDEG